MAAQADPAWCSDERYARIGLSILGEPGDPVLGALMGAVSAAEVMRVVLTGADLGLIDLDLFGKGLQASALRTAAVDRVVKRMRSRIAQLPSPRRLDAWQGLGLRPIGPGEPEWPSQLDDLGDGRPLVLWLRGAGDLRFACLRSAAVVGSRAATAYGSLVATELAADLAARSITVISGGAFGIDACAHRGALSAGGSTIAVLAGGLSFGYPKGHSELFATIGESGVMVSESPPDKAPNRPGFLVRTA